MQINQARNINGELGFFYSNGNVNDNIPIEIFSIHSGVSKLVKPLTSKDTSFKSYALIGLSAGAEVLNNGTTELGNGAIIENNSKTVVGGYLGLTNNIKLSNKVSVVTRFISYYHNSNISNFKYLAGAGLMYNF